MCRRRKLSYIAFALFFQILPLFSQSEWTEETRTVKLLFVGDIMGHDSQIQSAEVEKNKLYDYTTCFELVAPIITQADIAIGNLELTLPGKPPYRGYPRFRSHDDLALDLRYSGFDLLLTANNHSNDAGKEGLINTINTLDAYGFYHTGTFQSAGEKEAFYPLIVYKNNLKLAFLNYTYGTNGLPAKSPAIVNLIDEEQIERDMAIARGLKPDAIIVVMHWGKEYKLYESARQERLASKLFEWGAKLVIGAHPHVVQPLREHWLKGDNGSEEKVLVAYSLGNFISGQRRLNTDGGIMLEVELEKDIKTQKTSIGAHHYIPVWRYIQKAPDGRQTFMAVPVSAFEHNNELLKMTAANLAALRRFAKAIRSHLSASDSPERKMSLKELGFSSFAEKK